MYRVEFKVQYLKGQSKWEKVGFINVLICCARDRSGIKGAAWRVSAPIAGAAQR